MKRAYVMTFLAFTGCSGGSPAVPAGVSGAVKLHGQPLSGGVIAFTPDSERGGSGRPIAAVINGDGSFALPDNVPPGWYRVSLSDPAGAWTADGVHFPNHLRRPDTSGLIREVKAGHAHTFEFHIDWKR